MSDRDEWGAEDEGWKDAASASSPPPPEPPTAAVPVEGDPGYLGPEYDEEVDGAGGGPAGPPAPDGYEEDGDGPDNRRWLLVTALLAVLILGVAAAVVVAGGKDDDGGRESASDVETDGSSTTSTTGGLALPGAVTSTTEGTVDATTSTTSSGTGGSGGSGGSGGGSTTSTTRRPTTTTTVDMGPPVCSEKVVGPGDDTNKPVSIQVCASVSRPVRGVPVTFTVNAIEGDQDAHIDDSCVRMTFNGSQPSGCAPGPVPADGPVRNVYRSETITFDTPGRRTVRAAVASAPGTPKGSYAEVTWTIDVQ